MSDIDERLHSSAVSTARLLEIQADPEVMKLYDQVGLMMQQYASILLRAGVSPLTVLSQLSTIPGAAWCQVMGIAEIKVKVEYDESERGTGENDGQDATI